MESSLRILLDVGRAVIVFYIKLEQREVSYWKLKIVYTTISVVRRNLQLTDEYVDYQNPPIGRIQRLNWFRKFSPLNIFTIFFFYLFSFWFDSYRLIFFLPFIQPSLNFYFLSFSFSFSLSFSLFHFLFFSLSLSTSLSVSLSFSLSLFLFLPLFFFLPLPLFLFFFCRPIINLYEPPFSGPIRRQIVY